MKFVSILVLFPALMWGTVYFEPNRGQMESSVAFAARTPRGNVGLRPGKLICRDGREVTLEGANPESKMEGESVLAGVSHYALHSDPSRWLYDVPHYSSVVAREVYPGIDVQYHENRGNVEFDFEIAPGGDVSHIRLRFGGVIRISENGDLVSSGVTLRKPRAWQEKGEGREPVPVEFALRGTRVAGLRVGKHDRRLPLIVDPVIDFATYLGGTSNDFDTRVIADSSGAVYMAGSTYSTDFPASPLPGYPLNAPEVLPNPTVYVTRLKPDASTIEWSFFVGGSALNQCMGIAQDALGHIYVYGITTSADFPVTPGAWKTAINSSFNDEFVLKLDARTGHIVAGTYLGLTPRNGPLSASPVAVDSAGGVYAATYMADSSFQPTPGAYRTTGAPSYASQNAALLRLNANLTAVVYATYIDLGTISGLQVDSSGNAVFAGNGGIPFPAVNPIPGIDQTANRNLYVAKINASGSKVIFASLLDGNYAREADLGDLMLDSAGNIYLTGETSDPQFPQVNPLALDPLPANYPAPDATWPSPFLSVLPPQGGQYTQSTFLYGPQYSTPAGTLPPSWIRFVNADDMLCVAGIGNLGRFVQTTGGLVGTPPDSFSPPSAGSTLLCLDPAHSRFAMQTKLPYVAGNYTAVTTASDGAILFAGVTNGQLDTTAGVVQSTYAGGASAPGVYGQPFGDAFLFRVSMSNPVPRISAVYPDAFVLTGQPSATVTFNVAGSGFGTGMQATVNGQIAPVTVGSSHQLSITVNASSLNSGPNQIILFLGEPGGGSSAPAVVNGINTSPGKIGMSPTQVPAGSGETKVIITATGLSPASVLMWGGVPRPATLARDLQGNAYLQVLLKPDELSHVSTTVVTVTNPGPGGGVSTPGQFVVQPTSGALVPFLYSPNPLAIRNPPAASMQIGGAGFDATTQVYWDGVTIPVQLNAPTALTITPPAGSLGKPGVHTVYAANGALISGSVSVYVGPLFPAIAAHQAFDPVLGRLYIVTSSGIGPTPALVAYDVMSGVQVANVTKIPALGLVAPVVSDDGRFVYVAGGANGLEVARFNVASGVIDLDWQVALPPLSASGSIQSIFTPAGSPESLIVTVQYQSAGPMYRNGWLSSAATQVSIYDRDTPRRLSLSDSGIELEIHDGSYATMPVAVFATAQQLIFATGMPGHLICWQHVDFDGLGVKSGQTACGPEPAELIHDHGFSYLTDGRRRQVITIPGSTVLPSVSLLDSAAVMIDPIGRSAWIFNSGNLTTVNLDTQQQTVTVLPLKSAVGTALYMGSTGPLLSTTGSYFPVQPPVPVSKGRHVGGAGNPGSRQRRR